MTTAELNILVRVHARTAAAEIKALQAQMAALRAESAASATAATGATGGASSLGAMRNFGSQLQWTGRQLTQNFTAPLAIAGGFAMKWALENETAMTQVRKVYGDVSMAAEQQRNETDALGKSFVQLSNKYGNSVKDVTDIGAAWASAGASGLALAKSTELTQQAMVLGSMDATKATEGLIAIQAQYELNSAGLKDTLAQLNKIENETTVRMDGLIEGFTRAAGTARSAGVSTGELGSMLASLVPATGSAANAGNGLKSIFARLMAPTKDATAVLARLGIQTSDMGWKSLTATGRLEMMAQKFKEIDPAQRNAVANTLAGVYQLSRFNVLLEDMVNPLGRYQTGLKATSNASASAATMTRELNTVLKSNPQLIKSAGQVIKNNLTSAFAPLVPLLAYVVIQISKVFEAFGRLNPHVQKIIMVVALFIALLGPLIMMMGTLYLGIWGVRTAFAKTLPVMFTFVKALLLPITYLPMLAARLALTSVQLVAQAFLWATTTSVMAATATVVKTVIAIYYGLGRAIALVSRLFMMQGGLTALWSAIMIMQTGVRVAAITAIEKASALARLFMENVFWKAYAALQAFWTKLMWARHVAFGRAMIVAGLLSFVIRRQATVAFYAISIGLQTAFHAGMLALQRGFIAAQYALLKASTFAMAFLDMAHTSIRIAIQQTFWAASFAVQKAGQAIQLALIRTHLFLILAVERVYGAMRTAIAAIHWQALLLLERVQGGLRVMIAKIQWIALLAAEKAGNVARIVINQVHWFALLAMEKAQHLLRVMANIAFWVLFNSATLTGWVRNIAIWIAGQGGIMAMTKAFFTKLPLLILKGMRLVVAAFASPWALAIAAVVLAFMAFKDHIGAFVGGIKDYFQNIPAGVAAGFNPVIKFFRGAVDAIVRAFHKLPAGIQGALKAVVNIVAAAAKGVYKMFSYLNPFAHHSPSLVENVTKGMAVVGDQFAIAEGNISGSVMGSYQSMKKFGAATAGFMKNVRLMEAAEKRKDIGQVSPESLAAYDQLSASVESLRPQLQAATDAVEAQEFVVKDLQKSVDAADKEIKGLNATLDTLKERADAASEALEAAKAESDRLGSMPLQGMRAAENATFANQMAQKRLQLQVAQTNAQYGYAKNELWAVEDAVFDNQMAQKRLQLQIAKTNAEAGAGADSVTDRYAKMQGEIENLMGQQNDLRGKGAGSDITSVYDGMIAGVRAAQDALNAPGNNASSPVTDLQGQLDALQKQAEIMDLEKALRFDPITEQASRMTRGMTAGLESLQASAEQMDLANALKFEPMQRQIEQLVSGLEEMPFDAIISGLTRSQADVARYTGELAQANAAVAMQQKVVDEATKARDRLSAVYDIENDKLTQLKDVQENLNKAVQDGTSALDDMASAASGAINKAKEAQDTLTPGEMNFLASAGGEYPDPGMNATIGREGGAGDQSADIDAFTQGLVMDTANMFGDIDLIKPIREKWEQFTGWWTRTITPAWSILVGGLRTGFESLKNIGNPFTNISNATDGATGHVRTFFTTMRDFFSAVGEWTVKIWKLFSPDLKATISEIKDGFVSIWEKAGPAIVNLGGALGDMGPTMMIIIGIILNLIEVCWEMVNGAIGPIFNVIGTLLASIIDVISGALKYIAGAVNAIIGYGKMIFGLFKGIFTGDWSMFSAGWDQVKEGFFQMVSGIVDIVKGLGMAVLSIFKNLPLLVWNVVYGFVKGIVDFFAWLYDVLVGHSIVPDLINAIVQWFKDLPAKALGFVLGFVTSVIEFFASLPGRIFDALSSLGGVISDLIVLAGNAWLDVFMGTWGRIIGWALQVPGMAVNAIRELAPKVANSLISAGTWWMEKFTGAWGAIIEWAKGVPGKVWNAVLALKAKLGDLGREAIDYMREKIVDTFFKVIDFFKALPGKVIEQVKSLPGQMLQMGKDVIQGLINGAKEKAGDVAGFFGKLLPQNIIGTLKKAMDSHSPSRVMMSEGTDIIDGLIIGVNAGIPGVKDAVNNVAGVISNPPVDSIKFTEAFDEIGKSTDDLKSKVGNLKSALSEVRTQQFGDLDQQAATQTAIQGVAEAFTSAGTSAFAATGQLDLATEGGRRVYNSMKDVTTAYDEAVLHAFESARGQGKSQEEAALAAKLAGDKVVQSFIATAAQSKLSDTQIATMITTMNLIPPHKFTDIIVRDEEARKAIERFVNDHAGANAIRIGVTLGVNGDPLARALMPQDYPATKYSTQFPGMPGGRAAGGLIRGPGSGTSDSILGMDMFGVPTAMVSNREYVVNAKATAQWLPILEAINSGTLTRLADGGMVNAQAAYRAIASGAESVGTGATSTLNVGIQATLTTEIPEQVLEMTTQAAWTLEGFTNATNDQLLGLEASFAGVYDRINTSTVATTQQMSATLTQQHTDFITRTTKSYSDYVTASLAQFTSLKDLSNDNFGVMRDQNFTRISEMSSSSTERVVKLVIDLIDQFSKLRDQLNAIMTVTRDNTVNLFQSLGDGLRAAMDNTIKPMFNEFLPMLQTVERWFTDTVGNIGRIWDGMREAVAAPSRFVVDEVYNNGVRKAWNSVNTWLKLPELPEHKAHFATGGPVYGPGGPRADKIPAMLSNGEHVIPANEVKAAGGQKGIYQLRQVIRQGDLPHFANGGAVTWPQLNQIRQELYPGSLLNDWVRPGANDYHGMNQAIDIGWAGNNVAQLTRIAQDLGRRFGSNITELIHKPGGSIKHGKTMAPNQWGAGTWDQHWNHVHWAMTPAALAAALGGASMPAGLLPNAGGGGGGFAAPSMADNVRSKWDEIMGPIEKKIGTNLLGVDRIRQGGFDEFSKIGTFLKGTADNISAEATSGSGVGVAVEKFGGNVDIMRRTAAQFGWGEGPQWDALYRLEMKEAGFNNLAQNPVSTAFGMGQFLNSTWAPYGPKTADPALQSLYMMRYIKDRHQDPIGALNHHLRNNWYDEGGYMMPGSGIYHNETGKPEPVFNPTQWATLKAAVHQGVTLQGYDQALAKEIRENLAPSLKNYGLDVSGAQAWNTQDVVNGLNQVRDNVAAVVGSVADTARKQIEAAVQVGQGMVGQWAAGFSHLGAEWTAGFSSFQAQAAQGFASVQGVIQQMTPSINAEIEKLAPKVNAEITSLAPAFTQAMATFQADPAGSLERFLPQLAASAQRLLPSFTQSIESLAPRFQEALAKNAQSVNGSFPSVVDAINNGQSAAVGAPAPVRENIAGSTAQPTTTTITNHNTTTIYMNGDMIFPGFTGQDGADKFIANLKTRAGVQ